MDQQEEQGNHIIKEARRICDEHGTGVTVTLIGAIGDQFVIIFHVASLYDKSPSERDAAIQEIASRLQSIKNVARVCYEVLPMKKETH